MTTVKLREVFQRYRDYLAGYEGFNLVPKELPERSYNITAHLVEEFDLLCHLMWMCDRCLKIFIPLAEKPGMPEELAKAHVWLGYIQGELRAANHFSIRDLRDHNREAKPAPKLSRKEELTRRLDACFCDDGGRPECDTCVEIRKELAEIANPIVYGKVPRRFRFKVEKHPNGSNAEWYYGCYFPQTDLVISEMCGRGTGMPTEKNNPGLEWLDPPANEWTKGTEACGSAS